MNLLLTGAFNYSKNQIEKLKNLGCNITFIQDERVKLDLDVSKFEAVVCNGLFLNNPIKEFKSLKFIQVTSAGLDRMPLEYIYKNNIKLKNARGVYSIPMAEWCICKILDVYKQSFFFYENQKSKSWIKNRNLLELNGKTASIIGAGDVGTQTAKRLSAFGVNVIAVDLKNPESKYYNYYFNISEINKAVKVSDIIIVTLPLTDKTINLFDKNLISLIKKNCLIINMSRGGIIDEFALSEAINNSCIMAAAIDVFDKEPLQNDSPLWNGKNILISPHNSFVSENNSSRLYSLIFNNISEYLTNKSI